MQAHPGRHSLYGVTNPLVRYVPEDHPGPGFHQIAILPASKDLGFTARAEAIPDWVWDPARSGRGKVVFDASLEGWPHQPERTRELHRFLDAVRVPRDQAVYLTQDRSYAEAYGAYCNAAAAGPPMRVLTFDYWLRAVIRAHEGDGEQEFEERLTAYRARARRRRWRYLCLNRTVRQTKALFLLRLIRDGLWDQGAISIGGLKSLQARKGYSTELWEARLFSWPGFDDLNVELRPLLPRLYDIGEISFQSPKSDPKYGPVLDDPLTEYAQTWFSVVTETEMEPRPSRITEKSLKPLLNFHPQLVLGNPGALQMLRDYGFQTFEGLIDETYDQELDPRRRFEMVFGEVQRLCALDEEELDRRERALDEVMVFNARHGLTVLPGLFRHRLDHDLVADILAPADQAAAPASIRPKPGASMNAS